MMCFANEGSHNVFHISSFNIEILISSRIRRIPYFCFNYRIYMDACFGCLIRLTCNKQFPDI